VKTERVRTTARQTLRTTGVALLLVVSPACDKKEASGSESTSSPREPGFAVTAPAPPASKAATLDAGPVETVEVPEVRVRKDASTTVHVTWIVPKGTAVNDDAPFRVRWNRSDGLVEAPSDVKSTGSAVKDGFHVSVRPTPGTPNATLNGVIDIVVCDATTHSICLPVRRNVELGFVVATDAADKASVAIPLPEARPN
jgi:hypothetical protein